MDSDSVGDSGLLVHEGFHGSTVGRVSHEVGQLLLHGLLRELVDLIKLVPEGFFIGLGGGVRVEVDLSEFNGVHYSHGGLVARVSI